MLYFGIQNIERQRPAVEDLIMKGAKVELVRLRSLVGASARRRAQRTATESFTSSPLCRLCLENPPTKDTRAHEESRRSRNDVSHKTAIRQSCCSPSSTLHTGSG